MKRLTIVALLVALLFSVGAIADANADDRRAPSTAKCPQWWELARRVGWPANELHTLDRVIWRESRCRADVENLRDPWGGSVGLTQVNRGWVRWLREQGVIGHSSDLFEPRANLEAALVIYLYSCARHGECWLAWGLRTV